MTGQNEAPATGYVKKETVLWVATITLVVGFLIGVVVTVYKSGSGLPVSSAPPQSQPPPPQTVTQGPSVETAAKIFELEKLTSQNPEDVQAWIQLGNLYFDSENYEKAINAYQKSLALQPDNANVLTNMGIMYRHSGKPAEAVKAFDKANVVDPRHEVARFNKGIVLMHDLNDIAGAKRSWEELVAINPAAKSPNGQLISELVKRLPPPGKP